MSKCNYFHHQHSHLFLNLLGLVMWIHDSVLKCQAIFLCPGEKSIYIYQLLSSYCYLNNEDFLSNLRQSSHRYCADRSSIMMIQTGIFEIVVERIKCNKFFLVMRHSIQLMNVLREIFCRKNHYHFISSYVRNNFPIGHNCSGNIKPSHADVELSSKIKDAAQLMDIKLLDHLVITQDTYYSFADDGLV